MSSGTLYMTDRSPWELLWSRNFLTAPAMDGTSTPGAVTIFGDAAILINPGGNFLHPTAGVSIVEGLGLKLDTTGATTGPNDNQNGSTGAGVRWGLTSILPAAKWPNATPGPEKLWSELVLEAIVDVSGIASNGEGIACGISNNASFGLGTGTATVQVSGAINCTQEQHAASYVTSGSAAIATVGMPAVPDTLICSTTPQGGGSYWSTGATGVIAARKKYSRDQHVAAMVANGPNTTGGYLRSTSQVYVGILDTGKTALVAYVKSLKLYGRQRDERFHNSPGSLSSVAAA